MTDSIEAIRDQLSGAERLTPDLVQRLGGLDASLLPEALDAWSQAVERAWTADDVALLRQGLLTLLDRALDHAQGDAVAAALGKRRADLLESLGLSSEATAQQARSFRALPDEESLAWLEDRAEPGPALRAEVLDLRVRLATEPSRRAEAARALAGMKLAANALADAEFLYHQVLEIDPDDAVATAGLESIGAARNARQDMLDALRAEVEAEDEPEARSVALLSLAEALFEADPDDKEGLKALEAATEADPGNDAAARLLITRRCAERKWAPARRLAELWIAATDDDHRLDAQRFAGLALAQGARHRDFVVEQLTPVHAASPGDPEVVDALDEALTNLGQLDTLIEVLTAARRATRQRSHEKRWLVREAEILWRDKGDYDEAEKMFRRVRAADPRDMTALEFFEDQLTRAEDWKRLSAVLSQKFALAEGELRVAVAIQMAEVAEHRLDSPDKAIEAYKRVLIEEPTNPVAAERLSELYRRTGKWHALIDFLNGRIRRLPDEAVEDKVATLFQIIEIYQDPDKLPVEEMVIHTYNRVVQLSPTNVAALDNLAQRYEDSRRWSELVGVLQKKIEATVDEDQLLDLFHQVADLYLSKMSSESQAIPFLERILEVDPTNLEIVRQLRSIYKAKHNLERLYSTYLTELSLLEGGEREPVLTELAVLATDKLHWHDQAIGHWEELLQLSPRNEKAATTLATLYQQEGRWDRYVELLEGRLDSARTRRRRTEVLETLGRIRFECLGQIDEAEAAYQQILELTPGSRSAREALQRIYISAHAWDKLKALYADQGDWRGYIGFLDETLGREDDPGLRAEIILETARVYEDRLNDLGRAIGRLEALHAEDPEDVAVAGLLEERYQRANRPDDRLRMLQVIAELDPAPEQRLDALRRSVALLNELGRPSDAFDQTRRLADLLIDEGRPVGEALESLYDAATAATRLPDLAEWYGEAAPRAGDLAERQDLLRRHALLLEGRLRRAADAIVVYEELSALAEDDPQALDALERLTYDEQDWEGYERVLRRKLEALERRGDEAGFRAAALRLGQLYAEILDDPDQAVDCYRRILDRQPGDPDAVEALDSLFTGEERWEDLLTLLQSELDRAEGAVIRAELRVRIARVSAERLGDVDGALDLLALVLDDEPARDDAIEVLWRIFEGGEARERVDLLLAPLLRQRAQWERLDVLLSERLDTVHDTGPRRALIHELATLREHDLADPTGAFALRLQHVALDPTDPQGRAALEGLAAEAGDWDPVAALYACAVGLAVEPPAPVADVPIMALDPEAERPLLRRLAELREAQLDDPQGAIECHERLLADEPEDLEALTALERLHARRQDWDALLAIYRQKVEVVWEADEKKSVYLDICQLLRDELGRPEEAVEYYRNILALDEHDHEVIADLEGLYTEFERWDDLVDLLRLRLSQAETSEQRVDILQQLAAIFRDQLDDIEQAVDAYIATLGEEDGHEATMIQLESLLERSDHPSYEQFALRVADVIQPWLDARRAWKREIAVLRVRARLAASDRERAIHLRTIGARAEERGNDLPVAFEAFAEAVRLDPGNHQGVASLARVATAAQRWEAWTTTLEESVPPGEVAVAIGLLLSAGELSRDRLDDPERAMANFEQVLDLEPMHPAALAALDPLYETAGREADRIGVIERLAEVSDDDAARRALRFEAARRHRELGNTEEAIEGFVRIVDSGDPAHEPLAGQALDALQQLYADTEQHLLLVEVLMRKAEFTSIDRERKEWLFQAAELQQTRLDNPEEAVVLYERVRTMDPTDRTAFNNLRRLLGTLGRWDDLEELLLDARARATSDLDANTYDFMLGQLYDNELARGSESLDRYEAILARTPDFRAAHAALQAASQDPDLGLRATSILADAYRAIDDAESLMLTLLDRVERWPDEIDRAATRLELARLAEHRFHEKDAAFEHLRYAALERWDSPPTLRLDLVRLARETGRFEELEITDREVLDRVAEPEQRLVILTEMARVAREERGQMEVAEAILHEILEEMPGHTPTLEFLRDLYEESGRAGDMVEILRLQAEHTDDRHERLGTLYMIAAIQQHQLQDPVAAVDTLEQILLEDPTERDAYGQIEAIFTAQADYEAVITTIRREIAVVHETAEAVALREQIARHLLRDLEDRDRAMAEAMTLLEHDRQNAVAIDVLEDCLLARHAYQEVFNTLAPLYERAQRWDDLLALYRNHADEGDLEARLFALNRTLDVQRAFAPDPHGAFDTLQAIVRLTPDDRERWEALEAAAKRVDALPEVAAFYEGLLDDVPNPVPLALRAAEMNEHTLKTPEAAVPLYRRVLEVEPGNAAAIEALTRLLGAPERAEELAELKEHAVQQTVEVRETRRLLLELAELYEGPLSDPERSVEALQRLLDVEPTNREAFGRLERSLRAQERWRDLEDLLRRWLQVIDDLHEGSAVRHRLATLLTGPAEDVMGGLDVIAQTLEESPGHEDTVALLEGLLAEPPGPADDAAFVRARVAELLDRAYSEDADWPKWEAVYRAQLDGTDDPETRMLLHTQLGTLYLDRAGRPEEGFAELGEAFDLDYGNHEVREVLEALAEEHELWAELVQVYERGLDGAPSDEVRADIIERVAVVLETHLDDTDAAAARYERLLELRPDHRGAMDALQAWYEAGERWAPLAELLQLRLAAADEASERIPLLYRLSDLQLDRLGERELAVEHLRDVLALDETQREAIERLEALHELAEEWEDLVAIYRRKLGQATEFDERIELLGKIAQTQERRLGSVEDAVLTFAEILELSPQNVYAITSLERLYPDIEDWEGLYWVLTQKRAMFMDPRDRAQVDFQLGGLLIDKLARPQEALDPLRLVLVQDPDHAGTVAYLEQLLDEPTVRLAVSFILEPIFARRDDHAALARLVQIQIDESDDPHEQGELLRRLGDLKETEGDLAAALKALGEAFVLEPGDAGLQEDLRRLAEQSDAWEGLAEIYREALGATTDIDLTRELSAALAELNERLGDLEGAIDRYRDVLAYDEFNAPALRALGRLLETQERYDELTDVLRRELVGAGPERGRELREQLADVQLHQLDNPEAALELYKEMVWADANSEVALGGLNEIAHTQPLLRDEVIRVLVPVHQSAERWDDVVALLLLTLDDDATDDERANVHKRVGRIYQDQLGRPVDAFEHYRAAVGAAPARDDLLALAENAAHQIERWEDLMALYDTHAEVAAEPEQRRALLLKAAAVAQRSLGRPDLAEERLREVRDVDPENLEAIDGLIALYESQDRIVELIEVCEAKAALPIGVRDRVALYRRIAEAAESQQDQDKAIESWELLLQSESRDQEALRALERLYREGGELERLAETMDRRAAATEDEADLVAIKVELGRLRIQMDDAPGAVEAFEEALELDEAHLEALSALDELLQQLEEWDPLARILRTRAELSEDDDERVEVLRRLADVEDRHLGDVQAAVGTYEDILDARPGDEQAIDELIRLYHQHQRWEGLARAYDRKIELTTDPREQAALKMRAAEVYEEHLDQAGRAADLAADVLAVDPGHRAALSLRARVLSAQGRTREAAEVYETLLPTLSSGPERIQAQLLLGKLYLEGDQTSRALSAFRDVLGMAADHPEAGRLLKDVLYKRESWEALIPVLEKELSAETDSRKRADLIHELARIHRDGLKQPDEAYRWLREGYTERRDHSGIVSDLIDHYTAQERYQDAVPLLGWLVSYLEAKRRFPELAAQAYRLGTINEQLGEPERALGNYQVAAQADSRHIPTLLALGRLYEMAGRADKALQTLQSLLLLQHEIEDDAIKTDLFLHLTRACLATGDESKARRHLKRLLAISPDHPEAKVLQKKL